MYLKFYYINLLWITVTAFSTYALTQDHKIITVAHQEYSIQVLPQHGFALISFKKNNREILHTTNLQEYIGTPENLAHMEDSSKQHGFRTAYGPSIGPWFGFKSKDSRTYKHGVCRYADWSRNLEQGKHFVRSRMDGSKARMNNRLMDSICGFHFDVEIEYRLNDSGLVYTVINHSEDSKGTFGIHWYFRNPPNTQVTVYSARIFDLESKAPPEFDTTRITFKQGNYHCNTMYRTFARFRMTPGADRLKARVQYPDNLKLDFYFDDQFKHCTLWCPQNSVCVEPVSGVPFQVGTFSRGSIRICPD